MYKLPEASIVIPTGPYNSAAVAMPPSLIELPPPAMVVIMPAVLTFLISELTAI